MLRDLLRTACVIATMAVASSLVVEVRFQLAAIDTAHRQAFYMPATNAPPPAEPGRLRAVGRAILDLADAGLGVVR